MIIYTDLQPGQETDVRDGDSLLAALQALYEQTKYRGMDEEYRRILREAVTEVGQRNQEREREAD